MVYKPSWFKNNSVLTVNAVTCGINKDGHEQYVVDPGTGKRSEDIDDQLAKYIEQVVAGKFVAPHVTYHPIDELRTKGILVPHYYDEKSLDDFQDFIKQHNDLSSVTLKQLKTKRFISLKGGHGSPSQDQRVGEVPYIKVSDLRAGQVNINPTNMIPISLAEEYWNGDSSGLEAYDLISPERASKNIGEFCILMPGQERIVLTKEVIRIRAMKDAPFDQFYLMWALSLKVVRAQWDRIVFMQTNREDVGSRALEIRIPLPENKTIAGSYSRPFREYYEGLESLRRQFLNSILKSNIKHHIFLNGAV